MFVTRGGDSSLEADYPAQIKNESLQKYHGELISSSYHVKEQEYEEMKEQLEQLKEDNRKLKLGNRLLVRHKQRLTEDLKEKHILKSDNETENWKNKWLLTNHRKLIDDYNDLIERYIKVKEENKG